MWVSGPRMSAVGAALKPVSCKFERAVAWKCAGLRPKFRKLDVRDSVTPRNPRGCRMYFCKLGIPHRDGTAWLTMQSAANWGLHTKNFPTGKLTGNFAESGHPPLFSCLIKTQIQ